jgi:TATA-binding protein-associated factor Taf7
MKWNADYDGNEANIQLDVNKNGRVQRRNIQLHKNQLGTLAKLLSVPSVNKPLEKRLFDDYDYEDADADDIGDGGNLFQNYISTPRRMRRRRQQTPQIIRINLEEPMMEEQEIPDFSENEPEEEEENNEYDDDEEEDPRQEMKMMEQLLNETQPSNRSYKKKLKNQKYPTHKVRFSPRNSSRTSNKRITLRGGRKKRGTRRRRLKKK